MSQSIIAIVRQTIAPALSILIGSMNITAQARSQTSPPPVVVTVATFNLRFGSDKSPNSWPERRPVMRTCFKKLAADIIGTQEGLYGQLKDIAADAPDYDWIGLGRDGGSRGEFMAIFYRPSRFEPLEFDHFWLSDTPNVIASTNWGNTNRRMATWVRFQERRTGRQFVVVNTHLDHALVVAREKGASLIRERVAQFTNTLPVLVIGDFNAEPNDREKTYSIFTHDSFLTDSWSTAKRLRQGDIETFHNFKGPRTGPYRIDWILTRGPWQVADAEVFVFARGGQYPSDHHPVRARLELR